MARSRSKRAQGNLFSDVLACAEALAASGLADPNALALEDDRLEATRRCYGQPGTDKLLLALGAVLFLDAAGTLQDASLPPTANEWEEFANPNEKIGHESVLSYSPVHNVRSAVRYPPMLLLPALNDARTGFWEALKYGRGALEWLLSAQGTRGERGQEEEGKEEDGKEQDEKEEEEEEEEEPASVQLVRMDMEGGHFRPADPSERARQRAKELGFLVAYARKAAARGAAPP